MSILFVPDKYFLARRIFHGKATGANPFGLMLSLHANITLAVNLLTPHLNSYLLAASDEEKSFKASTSGPLRHQTKRSHENCLNYFCLLFEQTCYDNEDENSCAFVTFSYTRERCNGFEDLKNRLHERSWLRSNRWQCRWNCALFALWRNPCWVGEFFLWKVFFVHWNTLARCDFCHNVNGTLKG